MMATGTTTNELATDEPPTRRRARRGQQNGGMNNLSSSFNAACSLNNQDTSSSPDAPPHEDDTTATPQSLGTPPKRRAPSRRARTGSLQSRLCSSLHDRGSEGIARTEGRLSVSFSDQCGLSGATIADILSGSGLEPDESGAEPEKTLEELMDEQEEAQEGRDSLGSLPKGRRRSRHIQLTTIISQKSMNFNYDPNDDDDDDDDSDKE